MREAYFIIPSYFLFHKCLWRNFFKQGLSNFVGLRTESSLDEHKILQAKAP